MFTQPCNCRLTSNALTQLGEEYGWPLPADHSGPDTPATALSTHYHDFKAGFQKLVNENADAQVIREFVNGPAANQPELQPIISALTKIINGEDLFVEKPWVGAVGYYWVHRDCDHSAICTQLSLQNRDVLKGMNPPDYDLLNLQSLLTEYWDKHQHRRCCYKDAASQLLKCELGFETVKNHALREEEAIRAKGAARHMLHKFSAKLSNSPKRSPPTPYEWDRMKDELQYAQTADRNTLDFFAGTGMVMLGLLRQYVVDPLMTPGVEVSEVPQLSMEPRYHQFQCAHWQIPEKFVCNLNELRDGEGFKGFSRK